MSHSSLDSVRDFFQILKNFYQKFNVQTKYGPRAGAAASSFFISGVGLVLLYFFTQIIKKKNSQRVFTRSVSIGALLGGKLAMKRLLQFQKMRANPEKKDKYLKKLDTKIESDLPDFLKLQNIVAKLEMLGQEDKVIEKLKIAAEKAEKSFPLYEYEYQMLLVELYIYKGEFAKAEELPCLNNNDNSDVRRPLFKAIIKVLLNETPEAIKEWEEFRKLRSDYLLPPDVKDSQFYTLLADFDSFERVVKVLREDIFKKPRAKF
ncbi:hypothetical protein IC582_017744 [Cucumis melo]|uniref:Uncharacterized protein LOC103484367 n=1 Tax=Cucumis melo TaxID=3656 RepID=A0A1S3AZ64_CUCME|nr:uncharacterized protein LOC103484367 [Cucumis melo]